MTRLYSLFNMLLATMPFVVLCLICLKANLTASKRARQALMPVLAVVYCVVAVAYLAKLSSLLMSLIDFVGQYLPIVYRVNWQYGMIYLSNAALVAAFLTFKGVALPLLSFIWGKFSFLTQQTSGLFYEYEDSVDRWVVKDEYAELKRYFAGFYYTALGLAVVSLVLYRSNPEAQFTQAIYYPAFGIIVLGEVLSFFSGLSRGEFIENILGESEESYRIANYGLLRPILRGIFSDRVLYDDTIANSEGYVSSFDVLDELASSNIQFDRTIGKYFAGLSEQGAVIDRNFIQSSRDMLSGKSVLFCNPFYRDLTAYIMLPLMRQLMSYKKCLVVLGRDSLTTDVKEWLTQGVSDFAGTGALWKVDVLAPGGMECDVGILRFCDIYNLQLLDKHASFLKEVGFVVLIEPSRALATGQLGLSLIVSKCDRAGKDILYCASDRNCDGLVDALSHVLKTSITEVAATVPARGNVSLMHWDATGEYMHHKILPNISRYLGMGTEISAVALKSQISKAFWLSSDKFPVVDMKWILGQYYQRLCNYTGLPVSQDALSDALCVDSNLWSFEIQENAFITVEDEFHNLFEASRLFVSRAMNQGFVNVISEEYLLREYMLGNVRTFRNDPKAIPTFVADFARTERNIALKLVMTMCETSVSEEDVTKEFALAGLSHDNVYSALTALISKHCYVEAPEIKVVFREELLPDSMQPITKKYYYLGVKSQLADYARSLANAYFMAEDELGQKHYVGARLYGHVFQCMLPGQFVTLSGKHYEVDTITPQHGVVLRRAADHINGRRYYRQLRQVSISNWCGDEVMGARRTLSDIEVERGMSDVLVQTIGYLDLEAYGNLTTARRIAVSAVPERNYKRKTVLRLKLPGSNDKLRFTICLLLNEVFKTVYPEVYQYIFATTRTTESGLKELVYTLEASDSDEWLYVVEDSEIDLGLIVSVERNLTRFMKIIAEYLTWYELSHDASLKPKYLSYGSEQIDPAIDVQGTLEYLSRYGFHKNPLQQARDNSDIAAAVEAEYNPKKEGARFCDFCAVELAGGEYDVLADGRERCNQCSATALRTEEQFKTIFKAVQRNMEVFFGIRLNVAIKVRMTDARKISKQTGYTFVPSPGYDGRVLGFARRDENGYSIYIENGSPKLAAIATIAHELTHIWQYENWDDAKLRQAYGRESLLEVYEGMAKWAEIQYLLFINEIAYAKREEIYTRARDDAYGKGFVRYVEKYPLSVGPGPGRKTPFSQEMPL